MSVVEWHGDFRLFFQDMTRESHWYRDHHGTVFSSLKYLSYHRAQNCKKVIWNYQTRPALNFQLNVIWCFSEGFSLFYSFWKQGLLMSCCASWPDVFLTTLCIRLDWQMLECFALIESSGDCGLYTLITQIPAGGERNQTGGSRGEKDDSSRGLQAVVAINPPQVRSRKGRWLRRIWEFPHLENEFR